MGCKLIDCISSSGRETLLTGRPLIKLQRRKREKKFRNFIEVREQERQQKDITYYHKKIYIINQHKVDQCCQLTVLHLSLGGRNVGPPAETQKRAVRE